jgi:hypothetical protein
MAHAFAEEYDVSPWEALLYVIRITAGRVRYCERVLSLAVDDRQFEGRRNGSGGLRPGEPLGVSEAGELVSASEEDTRNLAWWVETSERERILLAKVSKAAIDAGVAQLLIEKELRAGEEMAALMLRTYEALEAAGLSDEMLALTRDIMRKELLIMDGKVGSGVGGVGGVVTKEIENGGIV